MFCQVKDCRCEVCGYEFGRADPPPFFRTCGTPETPQPKSLACPHRLKFLRSVNVPSCCGAAQTLYIDECELHGECTKGREIEGVKHCPECPDLPANRT